MCLPDVPADGGPYLSFAEATTPNFRQLEVRKHLFMNRVLDGEELCRRLRTLPCENEYVPREIPPPSPLLGTPSPMPSGPEFEARLDELYSESVKRQVKEKIRQGIGIIAPVRRSLRAKLRAMYSGSDWNSSKFGDDVAELQGCNTPAVIIPRRTHRSSKKTPRSCNRKNASQVCPETQGEEKVDEEQGVNSIIDRDRDLNANNAEGFKLPQLAAEQALRLCAEKIASPNTRKGTAEIHRCKDKGFDLDELHYQPPSVHEYTPQKLRSLSPQSNVIASMLDGPKLESGLEAFYTESAEPQITESKRQNVRIIESAKPIDLTRLGATVCDTAAGEVDCVKDSPLLEHHLKVPWPKVYGLHSAIISCPVNGTSTKATSGEIRATSLQLLLAAKDKFSIKDHQAEGLANDEEKLDSHKPHGFELPIVTPIDLPEVNAKHAPYVSLEEKTSLNFQEEMTVTHVSKRRVLDAEELCRRLRRIPPCNNYKPRSLCSPSLPSQSSVGLDGESECDPELAMKIEDFTRHQMDKNQGQKVWRFEIKQRRQVGSLKAEFAQKNNWGSGEFNDQDPMPQPKVSKPPDAVLNKLIGQSSVKDASPDFKDILSLPARRASRSSQEINGHTVVKRQRSLDASDQNHQPVKASRVEKTCTTRRSARLLGRTAHRALGTAWEGRLRNGNSVIAAKYGK